MWPFSIILLLWIFNHINIDCHCDTICALSSFLVLYLSRVSSVPFNVFYFYTVLLYDCVSSSTMTDVDCCNKDNFLRDMTNKVYLYLYAATCLPAESPQYLTYRLQFVSTVVVPSLVYIKQEEVIVSKSTAMHSAEYAHQSLHWVSVQNIAIVVILG